MNKSRLFKSLVLLLCVISTAAYGQKQTKTYKEVFNVNPETVLDLNTTNADIQFETWNKDQIEVVATIEVEGATAEEAKEYFENEIIKIVGNSKKVSVATGEENSWLFKHSTNGFDKLQFDNGFKLHMDELLENMDHFTNDSLFVAFDLINDLPPMPPVPSTNFDYKAFQKDGEKYLKEWQAEFEEGFGKEYQERMKEWTEKREEQLEKRHEERAIILEKRAKERGKRLEERAKEREERTIVIQKRREDAANRRKNSLLFNMHGNDSTNYRIFFNDSLHTTHPNIFYFSSDGKNKNYKVKKTIKIRMPKANKIKMNVRHGEVKLAANTKNMDANLSYSTLHALVIDGDKTTVVASYSPVSVQRWNLGQLHTSYSDKVNLQEVGSLRLTATSSNVIIDRLLDKAFIKNNLGPITINSVSKNFTDLDVTLQNAELRCNLPETPFTIYVNGTSSKFSGPSELQLARTKNHNNIVHRGYYQNKNAGKSIIINSKYSEVVLD